MVQLVIRSFINCDESHGHLEYPEQLFLLRCKKDALQMVYNTDYAMKNRSFSHTKDRGEVEGTTKKMYRQKGTGGARHGTMRASQFRGGGITFGPKFALKRIKINKNLKFLAVLTLLNKHIERGSLFVFDELYCDSSRTKELNARLFAFFEKCVFENISSVELVGALKNQKYEFFLKKSGCVFVGDFDTENLEKSKNFLLASRNIVGLKSLNADSLNVSDLMNHGVVCIAKNSLVYVIEKFQNKLLRDKLLKVNLG